MHSTAEQTCAFWGAEQLLVAAPAHASTGVSKLDLHSLLELPQCIEFQGMVCIQTTRGKEARSFCRHEFQQFIKLFVHPVLLKSVRDRLMAEYQLFLKTGKWNLWKDGMGGECSFPLVVQKWLNQMHGAYVALQEGEWRAQSKVDMDCYAPTTLPYFFTLDNCKAHSFWVKVRSKHLSRDEMGTSLLQGLRLNPRGHDVHQIVEHAIGCTKAFAERELRLAKRGQKQLTTSLLWDAIQTGSKLFTAEALTKNLERFQGCVTVIAAAAGAVVKVQHGGKEWLIPGADGDFAAPKIS